MPTIVGILTFIRMMNTTSERLKARNFFICLYFSFYERLKSFPQLSWAWKKFYNLGATSHSYQSSRCSFLGRLTVMSLFIYSNSNFYFPGCCWYGAGIWLAQCCYLCGKLVGKGVDCCELIYLFEYLFRRLLVVWCRHLAGPVLLPVWETGGERESKSFTNMWSKLINP